VGTFTALPSITVGIYILVQWPQLVRGVSIRFFKFAGVHTISYLLLLYFTLGKPLCLVAPFCFRARSYKRADMGTKEEVKPNFRTPPR
jgi:hypothetical protein